MITGEIKKSLNKGQSLFEVVLAIAVVSIIVVGIIVLSTNSVRNTTFSRNQTLASRYAQEALEWIRDQRNTEPANLRTKILTPSYCLDDLDWTNIGVCSSTEVITNTIFKRQVTFSTTTPTNNRGDAVLLINVDVEVSWADSQGTHKVNSTTKLTDLREL